MSQRECLTRRLMEHPFQQYMGLQIADQRPGYCEVRLTVSENIDNLSNTLHGGVLYAAADVTAMLATIPTLKDNEYAVTATFNAQLLAPVPLGHEVVFRAKVLKAGKRMIFLQCETSSVTEDRVVFLANICKTRLQKAYSESVPARSG